MLALTLSLLLAQAGPAARVLPVGEVEARQVPVADGDSVLALCGEALQRLPVTVKDVQGARAAKALSVPCEAAWLFVGVPQLAPGTVRVAFSAKPQDASKGYLATATPFTFRLDDTTYELVYERTGPGTFRLLLADAQRRRVPLLEEREGSGREGDVSLLWAGDLNRDRRPDLILESSGEPRRITLFLSTRGGQAPRPVAAYTLPGRG